MTDKQKQKELEEMAEVIENALRENSVNYRDPYTGQPRAYYNTQAMDVSAALIEAHYRPEAEVRAETVKEFAEKLDLYLIKLFHQAYDSQKECEQHNGTVWENGWHRKDERMIMIHNDIKPFIRQLAEQFSNEDK